MIDINMNYLSMTVIISSAAFIYYHMDIIDTTDTNKTNTEKIENNSKEKNGS